MRTLDWVCAGIAVAVAGIAFRSPALTGDRLTAIIVSASFAFAAWLLHGVDLGGAITGAVLAFVFYRGGGWRLFGILLFVFVITQASTSMGGDHHEPRGRGAVQVLANLFVPAMVLILTAWVWYFSFVWILFVLAGLAELAADTVSSEIGERFAGSTYLLPSFKKTDRGSNGGVSAIGTLAGSSAAILVVGLGLVLFPATLYLWVAAIAGIFGMFVDSLFGAIFENRGWISNETVNLVGVASAVGCTYALLNVLP